VYHREVPLAFSGADSTVRSTGMWRELEPFHAGQAGRSLANRSLALDCRWAKPLSVSSFSFRQS